MPIPIPIVRVTKEQGLPSLYPHNQVYTFSEANEDVGKVNEIVSFIPIHLLSTSEGFLTGYIQTVGGIPTNVLYNKQIGSIIQLGSGISFAEYDGNASESDEFSKDTEEITIMEAGTHIAKVFLPLTKYILFPR